jgi:hypothetical protein
LQKMTGMLGFRDERSAASSSQGSIENAKHSAGAATRR